ncbi:hypothetical protein COLO4_15584 [Corchorus olitorius]|uniref:Uncharacterized protein n=1 Tax=Corchorus olitorius TaxID=93759 RepID=A0A1R3JMB7_9ROSI|nr:hypothetical protein COLO4_15584 [Corchorus olitorius]
MKAPVEDPPEESLFEEEAEVEPTVEEDARTSSGNQVKIFKNDMHIKKAKDFDCGKIYWGGYFELGKS